MRGAPKSFYDSKAWRECRAAYLSRHPLCEECLAKGEYTPAEHVHHIIWLDGSNYTNAEISLNFANLKAVCIPCHNKEEREQKPRRFKVDPDGRVQMIDIPPV